MIPGKVQSKWSACIQSVDMTEATTFNLGDGVGAPWVDSLDWVVRQCTQHSMDDVADPNGFIASILRMVLVTQYKATVLLTMAYLEHPVYEYRCTVVWVWSPPSFVPLPLFFMPRP